MGQSCQLLAPGSTDHHKLHAFICFLVPVHPGEKLHPLICPSMAGATKTCLCIPVGPSSHAGSSICEASQVWRGLWGELAIQKLRCNPSAPLPAAQEHQRQHLSHREHHLAEHIRRCVKRCWGHFQVRRASGCLSPVSSPQHRLEGFRREESPCGRKYHGGQPAEEGGGVCVQSGLLKR